MGSWRPRSQDNPRTHAVGDRDGQEPDPLRRGRFAVALGGAQPTGALRNPPHRVPQHLPHGRDRDGFRPRVEHELQGHVRRPFVQGRRQLCNRPHNALQASIQPPGLRSQRRPAWYLPAGAIQRHRLLLRDRCRPPQRVDVARRVLHRRRPRRPDASTARPLPRPIRRVLFESTPAALAPAALALAIAAAVPAAAFTARATLSTPLPAPAIASPPRANPSPLQSNADPAAAIAVAALASPVSSSESHPAAPSSNAVRKFAMRPLRDSRWRQGLLQQLQHHGTRPVPRRRGVVRRRHDICTT